jgi:hypothetical protein
MTNPVIGLWLNDVPDDILNDDNSLRELSEVILQGYRAQKMVVADNALLITMDSNNRLPQKCIGSVAQDLKSFLIRKKIPQAQMDAITLSTYQDSDKWNSIKDQITDAVDQRALNWDEKPLEIWSLEDIQQWLTDKELTQYIKSFQENDIDGENLLELNEVDLKDLGITSIGHRKLFMRHLAEARKITFSGDEDVPASDESFQENKEQKANPPTALTKELSLKCVMVHGLPKSLLEDEDTLFDVENLVFSVYPLDTFEPRDDGILVKFESPLTTAEVEEMKEKIMEVMKSLMLDSQIQNGVMIDLCDNNGRIPGKDAPRPVEVVKEPELEEAKAPTPPTTINYWKDFYLKLTTNGDVEDFFDDEDSRLNLRGSREVLATIRDVRLKDVKKDDPGIKHLKGLCQREIQAAFSYCMMEVMHEVEGTKPSGVETFSKQSPSTASDKPGKGIYYVGMSVEGLPRFITDDDNTVHGIQSLVFRDVVVRRLIVLDDQTPPALKVEFENYITSERIPQLARNLKNFLKAVNVDQKALNDVTIAFLEEDQEDQQTDKLGATFNPLGRKRPQMGPRHKRLETDDFLVSPGDVVEMTRTFMIEGIPENYLKKDSFLQDMPEKVFESVPLEGISVPPATQQADGTLSQTSLEIRFKVPQNIQKLPKIAMKLKKFLKKNQIPPNIVNRVTLQVRHDGEAPAGPQSELVANPVVGLVFKGIPKGILESNESLYEMESDVFTGKHPIRLMEPNEADLMLRITIEKPIHSQQDLTTIAQRLKRFLAKQGIGQQAINDVLVMSFSQEKWQLEQPKDSQPPFNPNDYVGIEIENMPLSIVESDKQLTEIEQRVFSKQKVVHMNVIDTTLRVTFGVAGDSKAIEKVARELKRFLSQMKIPTKQINDIIIAPHTDETWDSPS